MKMLTKKLLEAGLISQSIAQMLEKWGYIDDTMVSLNRNITEEELTKLAEDIETLVEDHSVKETKLEVHVKKPPIQLWDRHFKLYWAVEDEMGRFIVSPYSELRRGEKVAKSTETEWATVLEVEELYENDKVCALLITLDR
jgi:hypothetical protein